MIRACFFGTYNSTHPANRLLVEAFAAAGCEIELCHEPLWERTRDKMASFFGPLSLARLALAYLGAARRLRRAWRRLSPPDLVVAGFNGQLDVLLIRWLARRSRLVFAPLVTLTETLVDDRRVYRPGGLRARLASALDRRTLQRADLVLVDTEAHRRWIADRVTEHAQSATLYLGADRRFTPTPPRQRSAADPLRVLFYGQYVPLHGTRTIVEAMALLQPSSRIELTMIGTGPDRAAVEAIVADRGYTHVRFEEWIPFEQLPERVADCDVVLGIFGTTAKARMVIPTKVYQAAAAGRCVLTGDSAALREVFTPGEDVYAVGRGDPGAIAAALRTLRDKPEIAARIGTAAGVLIAGHLDARAQGQRLRAILARRFPDLAARLEPAAHAGSGAASTMAASR